MKRILTAILTFAVTLATSAQENIQRREFSPEEYWKILQEFVTREAELTKDEAEGFYPLLKEMMEEQSKNGGKKFDVYRSCNEETTEAEYEVKVKQLLEIEVQNRQIEENYYKKFHSVMSWKKVFKVRNALYRFNREALNRFKPHHRGQGPQAQGPQNRGPQFMGPQFQAPHFQAPQRKQ